MSPIACAVIRLISLALMAISAPATGPAQSIVPLRPDNITTTAPVVVPMARLAAAPMATTAPADSTEAAMRGTFKEWLASQDLTQAPGQSSIVEQPAAPTRIETIKDWLIARSLSNTLAGLVIWTAAIVGIIVLSCLADVLARGLLLAVLTRLIRRSQTTWDDILLEKKVFYRLAHIAPALVIYYAAKYGLAEVPLAGTFVPRVAGAYMVVVGLLVVDSILSAALTIYRTFEVSLHKPIKGYIQMAKIAVYFIGSVSVLCILFGKHPGFFLGGLGAFTAVLMLIFKDSILGLVAGIQLSRTDMVRRGDWIEMPKYGADGDVIDISLNTVKVQNWDKTITTIPAYALITDSFKNWRGMSESGGRRIKRALYIDTNSIKFCTDQMLDRFEKFDFINHYIQQKRKEVADYNTRRNLDDSQLVNGRRLTNIGTFRAYVEAYLHNHPKIHQNLTFLIRQLAPTEHGLPLEIYVFSNDQVWAHYEAIQSDIFDHLLAVVPQFELRIFQSPTGADRANLAR